MAKLDLGTKRTCPNCGARYYDLNKSPAVCPKCGTVFEVTTTKARPQEAAAARVEEPEEEVVADAAVETISLEEADEELAGGKVEGEGEDDEEIEVADDDEDATFLAEEEDEGDDVTDIIGGVDEDEE